MSKLSDAIKKANQRDKENFFGPTKDLSNKYFTFDRIIDENNVRFVTNNIITVKDSPVLVVGKNHAVYLKDFNIRRIHNYYIGTNTYVVKLARQYYKIYTFQKDFEDFAFDSEEPYGFDQIMEICKEQQEKNEKFALGWMK